MCGAYVHNVGQTAHLVRDTIRKIRNINVQYPSGTGSLILLGLWLEYQDGLHGGHGYVPQDVLFFTVHLGVLFAVFILYGIQGYSLILIFLLLQNTRVVLCCERTLAPPSPVSSLYVCSPSSAPADQISQHCGLGSPHHLLLLFWFVDSRTSHLTVATCLHRTFRLCIAGNRQSSLGVHISYELVHTPIAIPNRLHTNKCFVLKAVRPLRNKTAPLHRVDLR